MSLLERFQEFELKNAGRVHGGVGVIYVCNDGEGGSIYDYELADGTIDCDRTDSENGVTLGEVLAHGGSSTNTATTGGR